MADGDLSYARFPITLDINAPHTSTPQVSLGPTVLFTTTQFPILSAKILPMTGGNGKSRGVVIVAGRAVN